MLDARPDVHGQPARLRGRARQPRPARRRRLASRGRPDRGRACGAASRRCRRCPASPTSGCSAPSASSSSTTRSTSSAATDGRARARRVAPAVPRPRLHDAAVRHRTDDDLAAICAALGRGGGRHDDLGATWLAGQRARPRATAGLHRGAAPARGRRPTLVDLAGNDYLGLARPTRGSSRPPPTRRDAWGAGAGASRLVTGTLDAARRARGGARRLHSASRRRWSSRPATTPTWRPSPRSPTRDTLVVSDAHVHASLVDAVPARRGRRLAIVAAQRRRGRRRPRCAAAGSARAGRWSSRSTRCSATRHRSPSSPRVVRDARRAAGRRRGARARRRRRRRARPRRRRRAGRARPTSWSPRRSRRRSGRQGGAVLGSPAVVDHLVNTARPFIYDTGLAPAAAAAARSPRSTCSRAEPEPAGPRRASGSRTGRAPSASTAARRRRAVGADGRRRRSRWRRRPQLRDGRRPGRLLPAAVGARRRLAAADHGQRRPRRRRRARGRPPCSARSSRSTAPARMSRIVVVTGTGTGVGKTVATAALAVRAAAARVGRRREAGADRGRLGSTSRPTPRWCTRSPAAPSRSSPRSTTRWRRTPPPGCAGVRDPAGRASTPTGSGCWRSPTTRVARRGRRRPARPARHRRRHAARPRRRLADAADGRRRRRRPALGTLNHTELTVARPPRRAGSSRRAGDRLRGPPSPGSPSAATSTTCRG